MILWLIEEKITYLFRVELALAVLRSVRIILFTHQTLDGHGVEECHVLEPSVTTVISEVGGAIHQLLLA